jgi:hypothetical protein
VVGTAAIRVRHQELSNARLYHFLKTTTVAVSQRRVRTPQALTALTNAPDVNRSRWRSVTVWRKEGGSWKCVIDIWNDVSPSQ